MKIEAFTNIIWLATPTMHGDEMKYIQQAYDTNWGTKDNRDNR